MKEVHSASISSEAPGPTACEEKPDDSPAVFKADQASDEVKSGHKEPSPPDEMSDEADLGEPISGLLDTANTDVMSQGSLRTPNQAPRAGFNTSPSPRSPQSAAQVQWMVTNRMRVQLRALGYNEADIQLLEPERAAAILSRSIKRPSRGVPESWKRSPKAQRGLSIRQGLEGGCRAIMSAPGVIVPSAIGLSAMVVLIFHNMHRSTTGTSRPVRANLGRIAGLGKRVTPPRKLVRRRTTPSSSGFWIDERIDDFVDWLREVFSK
eukprot:CAMPEP_0119337362 /NCGR_PEP_ID=MMETSP1333-20130426/93848_1 /TAXON_ID=418940 /ORGANISM="Scyphosphaera apsteinii, Strain RCC1455" /LENGTH=264 /DNA_ID=CAMNT_0007348383 /DNA_START=124 /DNA_END=915 /DNA_ORIENTATION=+